MSENTFPAQPIQGHWQGSNLMIVKQSDHWRSKPPKTNDKLKMMKTK
jgi:hypothetical protein